MSQPKKKRKIDPEDRKHVNTEDCAGPELRYTNDFANEVEKAVTKLARDYNADLYYLLKWAEELRQTAVELRQEVAERYTAGQVQAIVKALGGSNGAVDLAFIKRTMKVEGTWPDD